MALESMSRLLEGTRSPSSSSYANSKILSRRDEHYANQWPQYNYINEILYPLILTFVKCSIVCLLLRVFGTGKRFRRTTYVLLILAIAWGISVSLVAAFQCTPIAAAWDPTIQYYHCFDHQAYFVGTSILNVMIDIAILALPIPSLWKLKLPMTRKLVISGIFMLGILYVPHLFISCVPLKLTICTQYFSHQHRTDRGRLRALPFRHSPGHHVGLRTSNDLFYPGDRRWPYMLLSARHGAIASVSGG